MSRIEVDMGTARRGVDGPATCPLAHVEGIAQFDPIETLLRRLNWAYMGYCDGVDSSPTEPVVGAAPAWLLVLHQDVPVRLPLLIAVDCSYYGGHQIP